MVPGEILYSQAVKHVKKTTIVADSMCKSIRVKDFNKQLDPDIDQVLINKYPAAHTKQILHYSNYTLTNDKPDTLIVMAGTNDVSYDSKNGNEPDPEEIANRIMEIGRNARKYGVTRIFINSLIKREGYFYNRIIARINLLLRLKCNSEKNYFIDNCDISVHNLYDGLHLNNDGNKIFMRNLLNCCDSYNPYLLNDDHE